MKFLLLYLMDEAEAATIPLAEIDWGMVEVRQVWERCACHGSYNCSSQL